MFAKTALDRITGGLLIALGVALVVALATDIGVDPTRLEFSDSLDEILEVRAQYLTSNAIMLATSVLWIAVATTLNTVFHYHDRTLALLGTSSFVVVGVFFMIHAIAGFALVDLAEEFAESKDVDASAVFVSARAIAFIGISDIFGLFFVLPFGLLSFGAIIGRTKAVAPWLGWLALVVALLLVAVGGFWIGGFWDAFDMYVIWDYGFIGFLGVMIWLVLMGGWLLWRGSRNASATTSTR